MSREATRIELEGALRIDATFVRWDGVELLVHASTAAPPGARFSARVQADAAPTPFRMKAIRCRKTSDGAFEIALRVLELPRAARERLDALGAPHDS